MTGQLLAEASLDSHVGLQELLLARLIVLDLGDAVGHGPGAPEEELEPELAAERLVPRGDGEPALELAG
jgi:hypothetical protein